MKSRRVLIIYYSFSSQTRNIMNAMAAGLRDTGAEVYIESLQPVKKLRFPIGSYRGTFKAMFSTFFRKTIDIKEISPECRSNWDLILLGGPTWSFQPSGPILSLLQHEQQSLFSDQDILPVISCRAFWKTNFMILKRKTRHVVRTMHDPVVFLHTIKEPWCTIGLFLKLAGRKPDSAKSWLSKYYPKYGHTSDQLERAREIGKRIGSQLQQQEHLGKLEYPVPL